MKHLYNKIVENKYVQLTFVIWNVMNFLKDLYEWQGVIEAFRNTHPLIFLSLVGILVSVIVTVIYWELLKWIFPED